MNPKPVSAMRSTPDSSRGRWTVGMIRKWFMLKGEKAVDDALRRLNYVNKMSVSQKNAFSTE